MSHDDNWQQQPWQQAQPQPQVQQSYPQQPQPAYGQGGCGQGFYGQNAYGQSQPSSVTIQQPKKRGWIVALVAVILFFALMFAGLASCTSMVSSFGSSGALGSLGAFAADSSSELDYLSYDAVGVITLDGTIQYDGTTCSPEGLKAQLDEAEQNPYIKAVVLRVNSGGGTATAGEEMATYLSQFSKPVVVSSASMNASAAYEISSQADYIFTAKTTAIGAIGTAMQMTDMSGLLEKLGIDVDNITSADSKDSSYGTRPLTEEERAYYQAMVDQINESFIETVAMGRGMSVEEVRALATGLTFTGMDAVENGLADEIGTMEDAVAKAAEFAGISEYETVSLEPSYGDFSDLLDLMSSSGSSSDAKAILNEWEQYGTLE